MSEKRSFRTHRSECKEACRRGRASRHTLAFAKQFLLLFLDLLDWFLDLLLLLLFDWFLDLLFLHSRPPWQQTFAFVSSRRPLQESLARRQFHWLLAKRSPHTTLALTLSSHKSRKEALAQVALAFVSFSTTTNWIIYRNTSIDLVCTASNFAIW